MKPYKKVILATIILLIFLFIVFLSINNLNRADIMQTVNTDILTTNDYDSGLVSVYTNQPTKVKPKQFTDDMSLMEIYKLLINNDEDNYTDNVKNNTLNIDTSSYEYAGNYRITGYTPKCVHCCGNPNGITASGTTCTNGRTVASMEFEFGTILYIKGYGYYIVEDTGAFKDGTIDMSAPSHEHCYMITADDIEVYVVGKRDINELK